MLGGRGSGRDGAFGDEVRRQFLEHHRSALLGDQATQAVGGLRLARRAGARCAAARRATRPGTGQPPGRCGGSASATSEMWPRPALPRCSRSGERKRASASRLRSRRVAAHAQPGLDERTHQPGPDGALVVARNRARRHRRRRSCGSRARQAPASAGRAASAARARPSRRRAWRRARPGPDTAGRRRRGSGWAGRCRRCGRARGPHRRRHGGTGAAGSRSAAGTRRARGDRDRPIPARGGGRS